MILYVLQGAIFRNKLEYLLYYLLCFLPGYTVFLCLIYDGSGSEVITKVVQYSKEIIILIFLISFLLAHKRKILTRWKIKPLDFAFLSFILLSFIYLILPIGLASFLSKAIYFKNLLLVCLMYFFGRNSNFTFKEWKKALNIVFVITVVSFIVVSFEKITSTHLHSYIGFSKYHLDLADIEPSGSYGLTWTFEAQGGVKRFGSIFSNPLEFSASLLISLSAALILFLSVPYFENKSKYLSLIVLSVACVVLAYSRASFVAFVAMLFFAGIALRFYRFILIGVFVVVLFIFYILFFAPLEVKYFVEDTLLFQNSSSITHLVDWFTGIDAMISNPWGLGLATSGNVGGVEDDLRVGGENQFIIFGVQMGILGMAIYMIIFALGIIYSLKAFRIASSREDQIVPFIASTVKFGLILPLLTSNAEAFLYVTFISWWMVGYSVSIYERYKNATISSENNLIA